MTNVSIPAQIRKLVELQKLDAEIYSYKRDLREKPAQLNQLSAEFESKKASLKKLEEKFKTQQVDRKGKELELQSKEDLITKSNVQLSQIKTNKEYTAKITEIEGIKADKSIIEEKILLAYEESDQLKIAIDQEKARLSKEEEVYNRQKRETEDSIKIIQDRVKVLETQRLQIIPEIEKSHLARYDRVLVNKEGLAIVPVKGNSCGGCFMNVPQQVINQIKMHESLVFCEMCARILYLEEDL